MAIVILLGRPEAATSEGYRHLSLEGRFVKWPQSAPHVPVQLTFALATRPSVDEQAINPMTIMPGFYRDPAKANRIADDYHGRTMLTAQQVEDLVVYLATLK